MSPDNVLVHVRAELGHAEQEADYNRFFVFTPEGASEEVAAADRFCAAGRGLCAVILKPRSG